MKAAVVKEKGTIRVEDVPDPHPGPGEVMIKVNYCGICGSDVNMLASGFLQPGMIPGHEFCGTIKEVGHGVEGWTAEDRVVVMPSLTCGACESCLRGHRHHCENIQIMGAFAGLPGAFAEYATARADMLYRIPEGVTSEAAATVEPCAVSLRAVRRSGIQLGDNAIIFGAGAIGLFVLQCAKLQGARNVYVVEPAQGRAKAATILGADRVFNPDEPNARDEIIRLTGGGPEVAYICTAASSALPQAIDIVRKQGKVMMVGGGYSSQIVPEVLMWKEVDVRGSFSYLDEFPMALELIARKMIMTDTIITKIIPLEGIPEAFQELGNSKAEVKVLVHPG